MAQSLGSYNPAVSLKRKERDVLKLLMSDYKVTQNKENPCDFQVDFQGPKETFYEGGTWTIHVILPDQYPYKSPSIGFLNKIFHPNVDEASGSVCLDVINQTWSPMFDLINVFNVFLPQLLGYPNPADPLNTEAASLMNSDLKKYEQKVKEYVQKYAIPIEENKKEEKKIRKESKAYTEPRKESEEDFEDDNISEITTSDVSELSEISNQEMINEIQNYY